MFAHHVPAASLLAVARGLAFNLGEALAGQQVILLLVTLQHNTQALKLVNPDTIITCTATTMHTQTDTLVKSRPPCTHHPLDSRHITVERTRATLVASKMESNYSSRQMPIQISQ